VYQASDGSAGSNAATVSITVVPAQQQPGGPDEIKPLITAATLTNKIFRVNAAGIAEPLVAARAKKGTTFVYTLSEDARVLFTVESKLKGRKVGTKCKKPTPSNKTRPSCTRYVKVGSFGQDGKTGVNRKTFSGKIGTKSLKPGTYRATLRATDAAGNASALKRLSFKVVRR
jgi:hypothetical protein